MRITNRILESKIKRANETLKKTGKLIVLGGDVCGTSLQLANYIDLKESGAVERTLLYGATKAEAALFLDGFLDIVGYSQARVLKQIKK